MAGKRKGWSRAIANRSSPIACGGHSRRGQVEERQDQAPIRRSRSSRGGATGMDRGSEHEQLESSSWIGAQKTSSWKLAAGRAGRGGGGGSVMGSSLAACGRTSSWRHSCQPGPSSHAPPSPPCQHNNHKRATTTATRGLPHSHPTTRHPPGSFPAAPTHCPPPTPIVSCCCAWRLIFSRK